jgi:hypothetical protein
LDARRATAPVSSQQTALKRETCPQRSLSVPRHPNRFTSCRSAQSRHGSESPSRACQITWPACWCGFVATRREHRTVFNFVPDERVLTLLEVGDALLADNAEHVAACCNTEEES